jgi:hypothetical protein
MLPVELEQEERPRCWWRIAGLAVFCLIFVGAITLFGTGAADGATAPRFTEVPPLAGTPPWGFHTGDPVDRRFRYNACAATAFGLRSQRAAESTTASTTARR